MTINQPEEVARCFRSPAYFLNTYGQIYRRDARRLGAFELWPEQLRTLEVIERNRLTVILEGAATRFDLVDAGLRAVDDAVPAGGDGVDLQPARG